MRSKRSWKNLQGSVYSEHILGYGGYFRACSLEACSSNTDVQYQGGVGIHSTAWGTGWSCLPQYSQFNGFAIHYRRGSWHNWRRSMITAWRGPSKSHPQSQRTDSPWKSEGVECLSHRIDRGCGTVYRNLLYSEHIEVPLPKVVLSNFCPAWDYAPPPINLKFHFLFADFKTFLPEWSCLQ